MTISDSLFAQPHTARNAQITGWGSYLPERIVTNGELAQQVDTSDEWIVRRTGIRKRHIAADGETTASMAAEAGRRALAKAGMAPAQLQLIIVATTTPDELCTPVSSRVQHALGATRAATFVVQNACTGFVTALVTAYSLINSGGFANALVIGAETLSRFVDWNDRSTCVLFGDGAGAVVLEATHDQCGLLGFTMGSDGSGADAIRIPAGGSSEPASATTVASGRHTIQMNGRAVFRFATRVIVDAVRQATAAAGLTLDDIDRIVPHQANQRIIDAAARSLDVPDTRFIVNLERVANTSAASVPVALAEALDGGQVEPDQTVVFVAFGAGLTWAAAVVRPQPVHKGTRLQTVNALLNGHVALV